ncbi:MAG: bifunctional phosphopantothenoylcysteine decarboxylase/phosphopantothenate--cysteine ligase CoaBC [Streptosporangiaceae bacterium]
MSVAGARPRVVLGVGAGIAAYKSCQLLRLLIESDHDVRVVPTADALRFVGEASWSALSGHPVRSDVWSDVHEVPHVRLGRETDLLLVAPATADLLAKAAHGRADDLLTSTLLTARCPVVYAPAMHTEMWEHPATRDNVETLRARGAVVMEPAVGRLTGPDSGTGRLPEPPELFEVARKVLARGTQGLRSDLTQRRVVVTAGGTREYLDPVRFLGNRSSGRQGYALGRTAVARGAEVVVIAAGVSLPDPAGSKVIHVTSTEDMRTAVLEQARDADAVVMAAAVADFRPERAAATKIKKSDRRPEPIALVQTPDILAEVSSARSRAGQVVVGFAAETGEPSVIAAAGRTKLARKGCDLLVVNRVGEGLGFESPDNAAVVLAADGASREIALGPKEALADVVWDLVAERLPTRGRLK